MKQTKNILLIITLLFSTQINATVYEDAEEERTNRWQVYDNTPVGATIDNVTLQDRDTQSKNTIESINAKSNENILTLSMNGKFEIGSHGSFFIDADNDSMTGYSNGVVKGVEYLAEETVLYRYGGNGRSWTWDKISYKIVTEKSSTSISSKIPLNMMDIGNQINYISGVATANWKDKIKYDTMKKYTLLDTTDTIEGYSIKDMRKLYVSSNGDDTNNGISKNESLKTLKKAFSLARPNDLIYLREGTYGLHALILDKSGTKEKPIIVTSYNHEKVIFKGDDQNSNSDFKITGNWIILKDIEVTDANNGIRLTSGAAHNKIVNVVSHHNRYSGFMIEDKASYNTFKNCDAHHMEQRGHADGFGAGDRTGAKDLSESEGEGNKFIDCRSWENADDGFDFYGSAYAIEVKGCLSWSNGSDIDGNGFKFGPDNKALKGRAKHSIINCMAWDNTINGFMYNSNTSKVTLKNNTAYHNHDSDIQGANFRVLSSSILQNNISILPKGENNIEQNEELNIPTIANQNSWGIIPEDDDSILNEFISTDDSAIKGKRNLDGTIPSNNFLKLKPNSILKGMGYGTDIKYNATLEKIFVIGDSTVHNRDIHLKDGHGGYYEMGWANKKALGSYLLDVSNLYNKGRSGSSSKSYKELDPYYDGSDWEKTKNIIKNTDRHGGAYLLIQFGHNDEKGEGYTTLSEFYNQLEEYVDWAKSNNIIPVLITPVERRAKSKGNLNHKTHEEAGGYAQKVRDLANAKGITLLDLQDKSWNEYNKYEDMNAINNILAYDDNTHFSPKGAKIIGGWVKELICKSNEEKLCLQFK